MVDLKTVSNLYSNLTNHMLEVHILPNQFFTNDDIAKFKEGFTCGICQISMLEGVTKSLIIDVTGKLNPSYMFFISITRMPFSFTKHENAHSFRNTCCRCRNLINILDLIKGVL